MADWMRMWHGAPTDPKWRTIAKRARVRPGDVWAVVSALMDRASQAADRGNAAGFDSEVIADALGFEVDEIERIVASLEEKGVLCNGRFASWEKYQPRREDNSAERVREHRKRVSERDVTHGNATEHNVTLDTEERREEEKEDAHASSARDAEKSEADPLKAKCTSLRKRVASLYVEFGTNPSNPVPDTGMCDVWVRQGYDPEIVFAIIEGNVKRGKVGSTLAYHERQIREAHERRAPAPPPPAPEIPRELWETRVSQYRTQPDRWPNGLGPMPDRPGCRAPKDILAKYGYGEAAA